jgi:hypothetical protein
VSAQPLDLSRPRGLGDLLRTTLSLYARHFWLFAGLALGIVGVVYIIVLGLGAGWLWRSADDYDMPGGLVALEFLLPVLVLVPLISATHAQAVVELSEGRVPSVSETLRAGARYFGPVVAVVVMYTLGVLAGLVLLVVPGIYVWVAWFVAAPAVVVENKRGGDAIGRSHDLVQGSWLRVFGIAVTVSLIAFVASAPAAWAGSWIGHSTGSMAIVLAGAVVSDVVLYSFTALASTLLFFDLRTRRTVTAATHAAAAER